MKPHTFRYRIMESDLPASTRAVAQVLATRANYETGAVKVSIRRLSQWTGYSVNTVRAALQQLTLSGWLIVLGQKHERSSRDYKITVPAVSVSDTNMDGDEPVDEVPDFLAPVSVSDTGCISDSHKAVSVAAPPTPLRDLPRSAPTLPTPAASLTEPVADLPSRDAVVVAMERALRMP